MGKMDPKPTDGELIRRIVAGDTGPFAILVERYQHMVYTLAVRMLRNPERAEEAAQDIFVKAYQALGGFRGTSKFSTWLYRIAYHRCLDEADRIRRELRYLGDSDPDRSQQADPETVWTRLMDAERSALLEKALDGLPPDDRALLSLFYLQEQSLSEIAEITGKRPGTIKVGLFRARERLKEILSASAGYAMLRSYGR